VSKPISKHGEAAPGSAVVHRLNTLLKGVELDCGCRSRLQDALARFEALECRRTAREHIQEARRQRERIEAILFFLKDLDELAPGEADGSVYTEIVLLFEDIAAIARKGSDAMRQLSDSSH
jgi:hypothetical protein